MQIKNQTKEGTYPKQGSEIRSYLDVVGSFSPRLVSNSSFNVTVDDKSINFSSYFRKDKPFFDIELTKIIQIKENNYSFVEGGRSAGFKTSFVPNHSVEIRDLGYPKLFDDTSPYEDMSESNAIGYLNFQESSIYEGSKENLYPYVFDSFGQLDPGSYDGVIEPFPIRSLITRRILDRPFSARRVRCSISGFHENQFGELLNIDQSIFYYEFSNKVSPYLEHSDEFELPYEQKRGYFSDEILSCSPSDDSGIHSEIVEKVDEEIRDLISLAGRSSVLQKKYISSTSGYTFLDRENGTDSLAFLDQKGL